MPNPEEFQSKLKKEAPTSPPRVEYLKEPITDKRVLGQYDLIQEAQDAAQARVNVLLGMIAMLKPEGAEFNYEERCFMIPLAIDAPEEDEA